MIRFKAFGHPAVLGTHQTTFEFTKDSHLTPQGDCILGVRATFETKKLQQLQGKVAIELRVENMLERIEGEINPDFSSEHELVARKSDFRSQRTFLIHCNRACADFSRSFVRALKDDKAILEVTVRETTSP